MNWGLPPIPDFPVSLLEFGPQPSAPQPFLPSLELRFVSLQGGQYRTINLQRMPLNGLVIQFYVLSGQLTLHAKVSQSKAYNCQGNQTRCIKGPFSFCLHLRGCLIVILKLSIYLVRLVAIMMCQNLDYIFGWWNKGGQVKYQISIHPFALLDGQNDHGIGILFPSLPISTSDD